MKSFETRPLEGEGNMGVVADENQTDAPEAEREPAVPVEESELIVLGQQVDAREVAPEYSEENLEETYREKRGLRFHPPTREQLLRWAPFWGIILLGAILRFWALGDKPLHHDESLHA
ncbi:MAG: hypothetical protein ACRDIV_11020, partial [Ktedonobacteraceae bacterium]